MDRDKIKEILQNLVLLKWIRKFSADNLIDDEKMAKKFGVKTCDDSICCMDTTATKVIFTKSNFEGEEIVRFSMRQLSSLIDSVGSSGELIIPKSKLNEMVWIDGGNVAIVCPLPKSDKAKTDED